MRNATIAVYTYDELNERAQDIALNRQIEFYLGTYRGTPEEEGSIIDLAIKKADRLQTPWFAGAYIYEMGREFVLEDLRQYEYFSDGSIFWLAEAA